MTTIYIVQGWIDCESTGALRAFTHEADADFIISLCKTYDNLKPTRPSINASGFLQSNYNKILKEWVDKHPVGIECNSYEIQEVELE